MRLVQPKIAAVGKDFRLWMNTDLRGFEQPEVVAATVSMRQTDDAPA